MCECEYCVRLRDYKSRGVPEDVMDYVMNLEMDVEYFKAILNGNWPSGKEVLLRALEKYNES